MRQANPAEERVCRALRQADVITADQFRDAMDVLEATETCDRCQGTGIEPDTEETPLSCQKCEGTGQMRVLR
jgi:hypothetical protein